MTDDYTRFRVYLRAKVEATGQTISALAAKLGEPRSYLSDLLRGPPRRHIPTPAELRRLAPVLGVPFAELLYEAWGIDPQEILEEARIRELARERRVVLTPEDWQLIGVFVEFIQYRHTIMEPPADPKAQA